MSLPPPLAANQGSLALERVSLPSVSQSEPVLSSNSQSESLEFLPTPAQLRVWHTVIEEDTIDMDYQNDQRFHGVRTETATAPPQERNRLSKEDLKHLESKSTREIIDSYKNNPFSQLHNVAINQNIEISR